MKRTFFIIIIFLTSFSFATEQIPDILIWKSDTLSLNSDPLGKYPNFDSLNIFGDKQAGYSTACWRAYRAEWKIIDDQLYLSNIYSCDYSTDKIKADLKNLFPTEYENGLIKASWYKGKLFIPKGEFIRKKIEIYEAEWVLTLKNGKVKKKEFFKNSKFYVSIYTQNQDSLLSFISKKFDWTKIPTLEKGTEKVYASIKTGKNKNDFTVKVKSRNEKLIEEVTRILKLLPEFDFYYERGEVYKTGYSIPITFDENKRPK